MKRVKRNAASFKKLGAVQLGKVKGGTETITITNPDGTQTVVVL